MRVPALQTTKIQREDPKKERRKWRRKREKKKRKILGGPAGGRSHEGGPAGGRSAEPKHAHPHTHHTHTNTTHTPTHTHRFRFSICPDVVFFVPNSVFLLSLVLNWSCYRNLKWVPHIRIPRCDHGRPTEWWDEILPEGESATMGIPALGCVERTNAPRPKHPPSDRWWCHPHL